MFRGIRPYPATADSGRPWIGRVPEHWTVLGARSVFAEVGPAGHVNEPLLSVTIARGLIPQADLLRGTAKKDSSNVDRSKYKLVEPGDIAYNKMRAWQGAIGLSVHRGVVSPAYVVLRPRRDSGRYLHYLLRTPAFAKEAERWSYGITSDQWSLRPEHFKMISFAIPPLDEQAAIVRYLAHAHRRIDRAIATKRKLIALLEEQKHVLINEAVTRGLDPSVPLKDAGIPWVAAAPGHWRILELKRVLTALVDCEHKTAPYDEQGVHQVVRTTAVRGGRLDWRGTYPTSAEAYESWTQRATPRAGDVIFTREAPAGEACVVPEGTPVCLGQRTVLMRVDRALTDPQFLVHQIYAGTAREQIRVATQGSTVGHFNMDDIGWMRVLMPPLSEQEQIVEYLAAATGSADAAIVRALQEIELLREFRTRLTSDVVTGQVDVRQIAATLPDLVREESADDVGVTEDDLVDEAAEFLEDVEA